MTRVPKVGDIVGFKDAEVGAALAKSCLLSAEIDPETKSRNPIETYAWVADHAEYFESSELTALKRFADECEVFYKKHGYPD